MSTPSGARPDTADVDPARPDAPVPLNPDRVAASMAAAAHALSPLVDAYLRDETGAAWEQVDTFLLDTAAQDPETRWGTLETIATLSKAVLTVSGGISAQDLPEHARLTEEDLSGEDAAGLRDALDLLVSGDAPDAELPASWSVYAAAACPVHRYTTATAVLLAAVTALIEGAAQRTHADPVALWHQVLPVGPAS